MDLIARYETLKTKVMKRHKPFGEFTRFLEKETSWLVSPASTRFHLAEKEGLLRHSVGVAETLLKFRQTLAPAISEESCVIVGLFHDVGKIGMPGLPRYLPNDIEWEVRKRGIKYTINPAIPAMGLAVRSLYLVSKFIPLSDTEAQAIVYHDGQYIDENKAVAHDEEPLTLLVHWADYWTAHIYEEGRQIEDDDEYFDRNKY